MKRVVQVFLFSLLAIGFVSCGGSKKPADIETSIYKEFKSGNYEKGIKIFFDNAIIKESDDVKVEEVVQVFSEKAKESMEKKGGIKSFKITSEEFSDDKQSATVTVQVEYGDGDVKEESNKYKLVDGQWKIETGK